MTREKALNAAILAFSIAVGIATVLLAAGCHRAPGPWAVDGPAPRGWQRVLDAVKAQAPCNVSKDWGGVVEVRSAPYSDGWGLVWGDVLSDHHIRVVYTPEARDGALAEEACHVALAICSRDYREAPAKECAARVRGVL